eukprot:41441_1
MELVQAVTDDIEHKPSGNVVHRFNGINSYHSFFFGKDKYSCQYRPLSCRCINNCLKGNDGKCKNEYICGELAYHKFRLVIPGTEKIVQSPPKKKQKIDEKAAPIKVTVSAKDNSIAEIRKFVNDNNLGVKGRSCTIIMDRINDLMEKRKKNNPTLVLPTVNDNTNRNINNITLPPMPGLQSFTVNHL